MARRNTVEEVGRSSGYYEDAERGLLKELPGRYRNLAAPMHGAKWMEQLDGPGRKGSPTSSTMAQGRVQAPDSDEEEQRQTGSRKRRHVSEKQAVDAARMEHVMYKKIEQLEKQHAAEVAKLERQCGKWANKAYVASEQKEAAEGDVADLEDFVAQLQQQLEQANQQHLAKMDTQKMEHTARRKELECDLAYLERWTEQLQTQLEQANEEHIAVKMERDALARRLQQLEKAADQDQQIKEQLQQELAREQQAAEDAQKQVQQQAQAKVKQALAQAEQALARTQKALSLAQHAQVELKKATGKVLQCCLAVPPDAGSSKGGIERILLEAGVGPDDMGLCIGKLVQQKEREQEIRRVIRCFRVLDSDTADLAVFGMRSPQEAAAAQVAGLKTLYKALSLKVHPDKNKGDELANEAFQHLNRAHEKLRSMVL